MSPDCCATHRVFCRDVNLDLRTKTHHPRRSGISRLVEDPRFAGPDKSGFSTCPTPRLVALNPPSRESETDFIGVSLHSTCEIIGIGRSLLRRQIRNAHVKKSCNRTRQKIGRLEEWVPSRLFPSIVPVFFRFLFVLCTFFLHETAENVRNHLRCEIQL